MANFCRSFDKLDVVKPYEMSKGKIMPGYEHINVHMIFDIKMDVKFTRKSRLVASSLTIDLPLSIMYSSVVYRESVGFSFIIASLNEFDIFACNICNAYVNFK